MTDTEALVCYTDSIDSLKIKARYATLSGNNVTMSGPSTVVTKGRNVSVTRMTDTKAILCCKDWGNQC